MCCLITVLLIFGPRLALLVWYLADQVRFSLALGSFWFSCLGFVFLPWTLLFYLAAWNPVVGVSGFGWVLVGFGLLVDISGYAGGYGNRGRIPGRA